MSTKKSKLVIEDYSEKCVVIRGPTKECKTDLLALKCKYNPSLTGGPGWIYPSADRAVVEEYVRTGSVDKALGKKKFTKKKTTVKKYENKMLTSQKTRHNNIRVSKLVKDHLIIATSVWFQYDGGQSIDPLIDILKQLAPTVEDAVINESDEDGGGDEGDGGGDSEEEGSGDYESD
jgi:hypothetical protein